MQALPAGLTASIVNGTTYLTAIFEIDKEASFTADSVRVDGSATVTSLKPKTIVYEHDGGRSDTLTGYLESNTDETVTLTLGGGTLATVKYKSFETLPYPTHNVTVDGKKQVKVTLIFKDGLSCKVLSQVVSSTESKNRDVTYIIQQRLQITNNLPFEVADLKDLQVSFQEPRRSYYDREALMASAPRAAAAQSMSKDIVEEVAAPVSLGPVAVIPKQSIVTFSSFKLVTVDVKQVYTDIALGGSQASTTLALSPRDGTLLPSIVYINNDLGVPIVSFSVQLQRQGSTFETSMGSNTNVDITNWDVTDEKYSVDVKSNVDRPQIVRISGWQLNSRKDTYPLPGKATKTFSNTIPHDKSR